MVIMDEQATLNQGVIGALKKWTVLAQLYANQEKQKKG
jgi:hypothetical protein